MLDHELGPDEIPFADNIKVFVKPEPHKVAKLREGRLRLISGVSMVDTMIDRILFGWLAHKAMTTVSKTPCRVGWTPLMSGWRELRKRFIGKPILCLDKSAWDWTVQPWLIDVLFLFVNELAESPGHWWRCAAANRFNALFVSAKYEFGDGTIVQQEGKGIMKSGCYLTLLLNSVSQVALHVAASLRLGVDPTLNVPQAMGDDTIQVSPADLNGYVKEVEALGCKVKG